MPSVSKSTQARWIAALAMSMSFALAACGSDEPEPGDTTAELTYFQDIKPILDAKCTQCHFDGGIAPFSLIDYEDARVHAGISKLAIQSRIMPPWLADDACAEYVGNRSLTQEQIDAITAWVDDGAPEGDPSAPGTPLPVDEPSLSRVDLTLSMPEPYTPETDIDYSDDYRCFVIDWPEAQTAYVTGFNAVPGNDAIVHHIIAFLATPEQTAEYAQLDAADPGPGYQCFGGTGGPAREWVGAWAPGGLGSDLPPGLGLEVQPGSQIILQVHYNTLNVGLGAPLDPDQTSIEFSLDSQVDKIARILPWANPQWVLNEDMPIPANDPDVMHEFAFDPTLILGVDALEVYSAGLHMHLLGTSARLSIQRGGGGESCLLDIPEWDFNWQGSYEFTGPKRLERGDQLRVECHWDNTAKNQPLVDGAPQLPRDVNWGEGSTDEMCLGIVLVTEG